MSTEAALAKIVPLVEAGKYDVALPKLQSLVRKAASSPTVFYYLGLVYAETQRHPEAIAAFRCVMDLTVDPRMEALQERLMAELSHVYGLLLERFPKTALAQHAQEGLGLIAEIQRLASSVEGFHPDGFVYLVDTLKLFETLSTQSRNRMVLAITEFVDKPGLDRNNLDKRYAISSVNGGRPYSLFHLYAILYAGMKEVDPRLDGGLDVSLAYGLAKAYVGKEPPPSRH